MAGGSGGAGGRKKALVRNAADPAQVNQARERGVFSRDDELNDVRAMAGTFSGRRLLWRLLGECKAFETIFSRDALQMAYYAGRQDFGHFLMSEIGEASPDAWLLMQREANQMDANVSEPEPTKPDAD